MVMPKLKGGLEKVDAGLGNLYIRHPDTQELRIIQVSPQDAGLINYWHGSNLTLEQLPLAEVVPNLDESIRNEILTGKLPTD